MAGPDLPSIVLARGEADPEEPALFYPEGLDVRWRSWGALAEQVAGGAEALAGLGLAPGAPVAFRWRAAPDPVAADLAVQAAGLTPAPVVDPGEAASAGAAAWLLLPGETAPDERAPAARLPEAPPWWRGAAGRRRSARKSIIPGAAAGLAAPAAEEPVPASWAPGAGAPTGSRAAAGEALEQAGRLGERLERAAADVAAALPGGRRPGREIALASFDLRTPDGRTFLAWALATGAALYLEPDPRALGGSATWARPTLVAAPARWLVDLGRHVRRREERPPWWRRWWEGSPLPWLRRRPGPTLPFGRLRLLLVLEDGRLPVDDVAYWAGRGVAVLRVHPTSAATPSLGGWAGASLSPWERDRG